MAGHACHVFLRKAKNTRLGHRFLARRNFVCTFVETNTAETLFLL